MPKVHKPYPKLCCPECGWVIKPAKLQSGQIFCPRCAGAFKAVIFAPPLEALNVRRPSADGDAELSGGTASEMACPAHSLSAAETHCDRCGRFMCALCRIELRGKAFCPDCFDRVLTSGFEDIAPEHTAYDRGMARICAVVGMLPLVGLFLGPVGVIFAIRAMRQWRAGNTVAGGIGGLIALLILSILEFAGNVILVIWIIEAIVNADMSVL